MISPKRFTDFSQLCEMLPDSYRESTLSGPDGHDGKRQPLHMRIEKAGRRGKIVTIVFGFQHNPQTMEEIARILKQFCGAGGTVKGMEIEIKGDHRDRLREKLNTMNYRIT